VVTPSPSKRIYWILISVFFLFSLAIAAAGYVFYDHHKKSLRQEKQDQIEAIADLKVKQIVDWRKERLSDGLVSLESPFIAHHFRQFLSNPKNIRVKKEILEWMESMQKHYQYQSVLLLDAGGAVLLPIFKEKERIEPYTKELAFEALQKKKVILSDFYRGQKAKTIRLSLFVPIIFSQRPETLPMAVLLLRIDPYQFLYPLIQSWPTPSQTSETLLVRREGEEVLFLNELRHQKDAALNLRIPLSKPHLPAAMAVDGQEGVFEGVDYRGVPVRAALRPIPDSSWFLIAKVDQEEIYAPIRIRARGIAIIAGVLILGAALSVALLWRGQRAEFQKKQYEAELERRALAEHFDYLTRYANDIILLMDEKLKIVEANERAVETYGYKRDELLQMNLRDLRPPETQSALEIQMKRVKEYNGAVFESFHQRKDGTRFPVENSSRLIEVDGKTFFQSIIRNVAERKQSENQLRQSEEKFRNLMESAPTGIAISTPEGKILEANSTLLTMLGYESKEEFMKQPAASYYLDSKERKKLIELLKIGKAKDFEVQLKRRDGSIFWGSATSILQTTGDGKIQAINTVVDITERRQMEEALREAQRSLEAVVETSPSLIVLTDPDGRILLFNRACEELTGYQREEVLGKTIPGLFLPPEWVPVVQKRFADPFAPEVLAPHENPWLTKSGDQRLIEWRCTVLPSPKDGRPCILGSGIDITERKQAEKEMAALQEQFRQSQKMEAIGRLAGGVAHDFNNLLTIIKGYSQLSLFGLKEGDPLKVNIGEIQKAADRAGSLTHKLLAFSRRQVLEFKVLDLNTLIQGMLNMLQRLLGEDIELVAFLGEDLGRVKTDPGQIEQVLLNLSVNARDAMPQGGKLIVETTNTELDEAYARNHVSAVAGRYVMLSLSDTGVGMVPEVKERIFEPFFTTKAKGKGTGLGLSTVYGIVKQSGGNIWVYSEPGKGTTFKIYLPRVDEPLEELRKKEDKVTGGKETILIVEDAEEVRKLAGQILRRHGYRVLEASLGGEALILCEQFKETIHLLLTDVVMPGMSGRELAGRILGLHPEVKVLYMSGYTENVIAHHGFLEKGLNYIQKPFTLESLVRKVREVLDR